MNNKWQKQIKHLIIDDDDISDVKEISVQEFNVATINSIASKHKELRNKSKAPTFALT